MKKQISIIAALWLATCAFVQANSSYFLIQGPFGSGNSEQTYKWQVNYPAGTEMTGIDLLAAIFDPFGILRETGSNTAGTQFYYSVGNNQTGATLTYYTSFSGYELTSFTLNSVPILNNDSVAPPSPTLDWEYYVAGGSGTYQGGAYASTGAWNFANDGLSTRDLADGSFDGWVYGSSGYDSNYTPEGSTVTISGANNSPLVANFGPGTGTTIVNVPEPAEVSLFLLGGGILLSAWKRRKV